MVRVGLRPPLTVGVGRIDQVCRHPIGLMTDIVQNRATFTYNICGNPNSFGVLIVVETWGYMLFKMS